LQDGVIISEHKKRKEDKSMALYLVVNLAIVIALGFIARLLWKK